MKLFKNKTGHKIGTSFILAVLSILLVSLSACSSGEDAIDFSYAHHNRHKISDLQANKFSFKDSGDWYKVKFRDGEIYKLYINGDKVPDEDIYKYEDLVLDKREELRNSLADLKNDLKDFDFDMDELKESIASIKEINKSELREALHEIKREFKNFDHEKFRADIDLDELHESLAELKNIKIEIDMDDFHSEMEDLAENLSNIKVEIKDHDWSDFKDEMRNLKDELKNLDIDMSDLKFEMKKLNNFMKDLRSELVDDGYLEYDDEEFDMEFNKDELIINGKTLPQNLFKKYKDMYEEHFDKELDGDFSIRN